MIFKVKEYFLWLLKIKVDAYTYKKLNFVFYWRKVEKIVYLTWWKE